MNIRRFYSGLILCVFLAGCASTSSPVNSSTHPVLTLTAAATETASPTALPEPTATATETPIPVVRFAVIGDYGTAGEDLAAVAALIESWEVDFIITTGDNNYPNGEAETIDENIGQYFHSYIFPYTGEYGLGGETNRFFPSLGNHDLLSEGGQPYLDYFDLPGNERYYDFEWDFVHLIAVDSDWAEPDGIGRSSPQAEWVQASLAGSDAVWEIVYFHHAPYSSGYHGNTDHMQWPFKDWGASVVITGHDHHYERLLIGDFLYFVNGLGGGARYPTLVPIPGSQVRYRARHGAMLVEATPTEISFQFITVDGEIIDTFSLTK